MDLWISMYNNTQMANNLVKWWKTKFLNGYKQFSVECGNSKVSDTEELLGRLGGSEEEVSDRLRASCTTPPCQSKDTNNVSYSNNASPYTESESTPKKQPQQQKLNFEEFSCDVSVENNGGENRSGGQERQEFSFTLYDFDGHGKITKDDIAGLVTTIYEALGSSVKVPHYGSKTIKVKLTVSPDQRKRVSATIINEKDNKQSIRYKRDLNVTIRQGNDNNTKRRLYKKRRQRKKDTKVKPKKCCLKHEEDDEEVDEEEDDEKEQAAVEEDEEEEEGFVSDDDSCCDVYSRLSSEGACSDTIMNNERLAKQRNNKNTTNNINNKKKKKYTYAKSGPRYTIPNIFLRESSVMCNENSCTARAKSMKKRSGSVQRQELLEIIQANMDKNNLGFQTARKHSNNNSNCPIGVDGQQFEGGKQTRRSNKRSSTPLQYLANIVDPTHFYVDLASLQNTVPLPQDNCQYDKLIDAVMCVSANKQQSTRTMQCRKHRTRSEGTTPNQQQQCIEESRPKVKRRTPHSADATKCFNSNQCAPGHTSSPHHLRHRNRQEDQARAMAQVVRWLEREFSSNLRTGEKQNDARKERKQRQDNSATAAGPIERHEHHHVHEHIHHHYHHYQDAPLVV